MTRQTRERISTAAACAIAAMGIMAAFYLGRSDGALRAVPPVGERTVELRAVGARDAQYGCIRDVPHGALRCGELVTP